MSVTIHSRYVHITDGELVREVYEDGTLYLGVEYEWEGLPESETLSVNLSAYDMTPPEGHIYVKDYSESEGLPQALVASGIAEYVEEYRLGPFDCRFVLMKVVA